jgi:TolA-binding protein
MRLNGIVTALALALCAPLLSGCLMTQAEGETLRSAAEARDRRIEQLEAENRENREQFREDMEELERVLEKATQLLTRNSADVGAQVQQVRDQLAALEGQVAELRHKMDVLDHEMATQRAETDAKLASLGSGGALDPSQVPQEPAAHYQAAYAAYEAGEHEKARALFREYLTRYPEDPKAGNAQYWIGASYLQQNKPATALGEYRKVISEHAKSTAVNVALYGMADAFYRLHACTDAKSAIEALLKRKPSKALTDRAKRLRGTINSAKPGYCTS